MLMWYYNQNKTKRNTTMQSHSSDVDVATISDALNLASWNIQRTSEQLQNFISVRHAALPDDIEL